MTLTQLKLKNNKNTHVNFWKNFFLSIRSGRKILIFISVLQALGLPLLAIVGVGMAIASKNENQRIMEVSSALFALISCFCLGAAVLCGIFVAMSNFSYLHKKSQVDMIYSLPIKRTTKFLSDFLAGLAMYVVPYIAACIIADLILFGGGVCVKMLQESHLIIGENSIMPLAFQGEFAGLLAMIMLYTLSVLVICCCGSMFECVMNIFMINAVIPGAIAVIAAMFFANLYGVPIFDTVMPVLGYTSPAGAIIYTFYTLANMEDMLYWDLSDEPVRWISGTIYGKWILFFLLSTAAYFLLSMFLYKKRKAEDVSKPYVYKLLYYILVTVITMAISLIARFEPAALFPVIVFSLIVYLIFEVITNRGFKKIHWSFIRYGATMLGILIFSAAATATHGFGSEGRIYSYGLVSKVKVDYSGVDDVMRMMQDDSDFYYDYYGCSNTSIEYSDKDIIKKIAEIQKQAIEIFRSGKYGTFSTEVGYHYYQSIEELADEDIYDMPTFNVSFVYHLRTGGTATRNYTLNIEQMRQLFALDTTEQMAVYRSQCIMNCLSQNLYEHNKLIKGYSLDYSLLKDVHDNLKKIELSKTEAEEFMECYKQDYMETSIEQFTTSKVACYIDGYIPIRECFKRSIAFIQDQGGLKESSNTPLYLNNATAVLYPPNGYKSWGRDDITASFGIINARKGYGRTLTHSQTKELLKYASSEYYEEADCYVMNLRNNYYVIPYKYSDIAEKIYGESKDNMTNYTLENMFFDMNGCGNLDDYIAGHFQSSNDISYYDDLTKIYDMRFLNGLDSEAEFDTSNTMQREYSLLNTFFGYYSIDDCISKMEESGDKLTISQKDALRKQWLEFCSAFPQITQNPRDFYNTLK